MSGPHSSPHEEDVEHNLQSLLLINSQYLTAPAGQRRRRPVKVLAATAASCLFLVSLIALIVTNPNSTTTTSSTFDDGSKDRVTAAPARKELVVSRGPAEGVSEKSSGARLSMPRYDWTDAMLTWQRTVYHFQPEKNWINDPNGPLFHLGWYHLFYQYNPDSAIWGNITWAHAVSRDLIHWLYLPLAMIPDQWYDVNGVWTGSATILPSGDIVMLYTGDTNNSVQVTNLAYPANLSDPLLLEWVKYSGNPVMTPPDGIGKKDFRDPTTAWVGSDGLWRVTLGSKVNTTGISLVYKTTNFTTFELEDDHHTLHSVAGTGMWECVDFFPVSTTSDVGLDTSAYGPDVKHVLKASLDDDKHDYYALGTYNDSDSSGYDTWTPDNPEMDVGIGLRVDYGKYYASKTFYDQNKGRRILLGWAGETDSEADDIEKGWASIHTVPRVVTFDNETRSNIIQWPVEELDTLRYNLTGFQDVFLEPGSVVDLNLTYAADQLDIEAEFTLNINEDLLQSDDDNYIINNCTVASSRGALGPFGLLVLTDQSLSELTPVFFYAGKSTNGTLKTWFCTDQSRSTLADGINMQVYGDEVPVLGDENYAMRVLVDHSVVEAYGQGGRTVITSRIYPTVAIDAAAKVFLFNNATSANVTATLKVHRMESADIHPYPLNHNINNN